MLRYHLLILFVCIYARSLLDGFLLFCCFSFFLFHSLSFLGFLHLWCPILQILGYKLDTESYSHLALNLLACLADRNSNKIADHLRFLGPQFINPSPFPPLSSPSHVGVFPSLTSYTMRWKIGELWKRFIFCSFFEFLYLFLLFCSPISSSPQQPTKREGLL